MRKTLLSLLTIGMLCSLVSGCVDENPSVLFLGAHEVPSDDIEDDGSYEVECKSESDVLIQTDISLSNPNIPMCYPDDDFCWEQDDPSIYATPLIFQFKNYITGELPWSGGGGSGTNFQDEQLNPGMVWIDHIYLKCQKIVENCNSGDNECFEPYETSCTFEDAIDLSVNIPVYGNEGLTCGSPMVPFEIIKNWINDAQPDNKELTYAVVDIYAHYHDSGKISGSTNHALMNFHYGSVFVF